MFATGNISTIAATMNETTRAVATTSPAAPSSTPSGKLLAEALNRDV